MSFLVVGTTENIRAVLCGPQQHNEHCKGWRWHLYLQDSAKREAAVWASAREIIARRNAQVEYAQAAE